MKVWTTKYALTQGIIEADTEKISNDGYCRAYWTDKSGYKCDSFLNQGIMKKTKNLLLQKQRKCDRKRLRH